MTHMLYSCVQSLSYELFNFYLWRDIQVFLDLFLEWPNLEVVYIEKEISLLTDLKWKRKRMKQQKNQN